MLLNGFMNILSLDHTSLLVKEPGKREARYTHGLTLLSLFSHLGNEHNISYVLMIQMGRKS